MKVLQVGLSYNRGGIEGFVMNYYRELAKQQVQFDFICMYDSLAYEEEIKALGGHIYYVANIKKHLRSFQRQYREILKKGGYEVVHVNMLSAANTVPLRIAHEMGVPKVIAHSHNDRAPGLVRNILHVLGRPRVLRYATDAWSCGENAARWLFGGRISAQKQYEMIYNAVPVEKYLFCEQDRVQKRSELGIPEGCTVLGHIGRFEKQKNHTFLLEVFEAFLALAQDSILLLAGDGILLPEMKQRAQELGIAQRVRFLGNRMDIPQLLSAMDAFVFPSLFEGLPLTLLEVQASGLTALACDTITQQAVVMPFVQKMSLTQSAQQWGQELLGLLQPGTSAEQRREASMQAQAQLREAHFDIHEEAARLLSLYEGGSR